MFCCIRSKTSSIWHKRKAKTTAISTPPAPALALALALTENHPTTPIGTIPPESPPSYRSSDQQQPTYPLPPISVPSTISAESVNELQPQNRRYGRQFFYPLPPTSVPSTVSSLSDRQNHQEVVAQEPVIEPPTLNTSETDPYARTYVPYTDASPLKNNMFARSTGIYGRVNPDIMSGFGDDDDSVWLVDDEETTEEQSHTPKDPPAQLKTTPSGLSSSHGSAAQAQLPVPTPTPTPTPLSSARPAFRYQRPSFLEDEEFATTSLPNISADSVTISSQKSIPVTRRGYAPVAASILNLPGVGVDGDLDHKKNDCSAKRDTELPHKRPKAAAAASSSSSSTNLHRNLSEQQDDATAMAYPRQLEQSDNETADEFRFGQRYQKASDSSDVIVTHQRIPRSTAVSTLECVVCADTKDVGGFPRFSITATCTHVSNTCLDCIQLSIESDLSSKLWTEIRCPECRELLEYADIQRYANQQTFAKYETIALRAAMSEAENFIWCTSGCGSGQIHESGSDHPIVTCLHCNHRSCFQHNVAWHETLSCEEYDQLLADPENFRSRLELENERWSETQRVQLEADMALAQGLIAEDQAEARRREERHRREREQAQMAAQLARKIAARRQREEAKSNATLIRTTKPCTGCGWAIEKNHGCSHMTCIKCRHEFCWGCNKPWAPGHRINCTGGRH